MADVVIENPILNSPFAAPRHFRFGDEVVDGRPASWASLYRARSHPFDAPANGRIAVKVINHYGDEVLKVYPIS